MKNILIISYLFPPAATVGVFRMAKFTKYLRKFGWHPTVLTIRDELSSYSKDYEFLKEIPSSVEIVKVNRSNWVPFNGNDKKTLPGFFSSAHKIAKCSKLDAVLVSGPPFLPSIVAVSLKLRFKIPFVLDMRDPWYLWDYTKPNTFAGRFNKFLEYLLEPTVLKYADKIVAASPYTKIVYSDHYRKMNLHQKFEYVPNGFDPPDFADLKPVSFKKFTIIYSGKLFGARNTVEFIKAFSLFINRRCISSNQLQFIHIGKQEQGFIKDISAAGLSDYFSFPGYMPYKENLSYCKGADLLIILTTGSKQEPTTKIFDYVACQRPILAIGNKEGVLAQYIKEFDSKSIQLVDDKSESILEGLNLAYEIKNNKYLDAQQNVDCIKKYHRENLTQSLALILDSLI